MFESTSRYASISFGLATVPDGFGGIREVRYVRRRFLPPPDALPALAEHAVIEGDRLDTIAGRYLGDPTQFWRVCDANRAMNPTDLTRALGRILRIPVPRP